jgi:hypothetical protein
MGNRSAAWPRSSGNTAKRMNAGINRPATVHSLAPDCEKSWEKQAEQILDVIIRRFQTCSQCVMISNLVRVSTLKMILGYSLGETAGYIASGTWKSPGRCCAACCSNLHHRTDRPLGCGQTRVTAGHLGRLETGRHRSPGRCGRKLLADFPRVYILIGNTPDECVIGHGLTSKNLCKTKIKLHRH